MKIFNALNLNSNNNEIISFVGAGGKTTAMFTLAKELRSLNKKVLVTTTTAIFYPSKDSYDNLIITGRDFEIKNFKITKNKTITVIGKKVSVENKLLGLEKETIQDIYEKKLFDYILVEADGAKMKSIKAPESYEPVIPNDTTVVVGLIGLDCLGKKICEENVHRVKLFCKVTNSNLNEIITEKHIAKLILSKHGLFKDVRKGIKKYLILNKVESEDREKSAQLIKKMIKKIKTNLNDVIVADIKTKKIM